MDLKKTVKELEEFAKNTNREIKVIDGHTVIIKEDDLYYVAFNDADKDGVYSVYCGIFTPASEPCPSRMSVVKKGFLDHLSFKTGYQPIKTGSVSFDKKARTISNNPQMVFRLLSKPEARELIEETLNLHTGITVSINDLVTEAVPRLKSQAQLSIYVLKEWITEADKLEKLFQTGAKLKSIFYPAG